MEADSQLIVGKRVTPAANDKRQLGLAFPGVEESTAYRSPALKFRGEFLACIPVHRSAEAGSLAVRVDFNDRPGASRGDRNALRGERIGQARGDSIR